MRMTSKVSIVAAVAATVVGLGLVLAAPSSASAAMIWPRAGGAMPHVGGGMPHGAGGMNHGNFVGGYDRRRGGAGYVTGLAAGAILGAGPYYGDDYGYDDYGYGATDQCYEYRKVYDRWGRYLGVRLVDLCAG